MRNLAITACSIVVVLFSFFAPSWGTNHLKQRQAAPSLEQGQPGKIQPFPQLSSIALAPTSVTGAHNSLATVTLSGAALSGDAVLNLSSSNPAVAKPSADTVTVPQGHAMFAFHVWTFPVAFNPNVVPPGIAVTITASPARGVSGGARSATLTVLTPALKTFHLGGNVGGQNAAGSVQITGPAPAGGASVYLSSNNPQVVMVPPSITVAAGKSYHTFSVPTSQVTTATKVDVTARRSVFDQKTISITVIPQAAAK